MKRILTLAVAALALTSTLGLTACGRKADRLNNGNVGGSGQSTSAPAEVSSGSGSAATSDVRGVTTDLSSIDTTLGEADSSLAEADKTPEDAD